MSASDLGANALWTLLPASAIYGILAVTVFRRFSVRRPIRRSVNLVLAHVMELGLFLDSPSLVFGAQRDLLRENIRLLRLVILPGAILVLLFALIFRPMNALYGRAPLPVGEPSVVTIQMKDTVIPAVQLEAPPGIVIETPGVRDGHDRQISWRVRAARISYGDLRFRLDNRVVTSGIHSFFLRDPAIRSIRIEYPKANILSLPWEAWFILVSSVSALIVGLCWKQ
ncbi:MAG TPA: hypothetical protein VME17_24190 [Bryobacteraceae bacterium]|nr:hypothetical protein [Bryobacteraceae bacterium]